MFTAVISKSGKITRDIKWSRTLVCPAIDRKEALATFLDYVIDLQTASNPSSGSPSVGKNGEILEIDFPGDVFIYRIKDVEPTSLTNHLRESYVEINPSDRSLNLVEASEALEIQEN